MNSYLKIAVVGLLGIALGYLLAAYPGESGDPAQPGVGGEREVLYWKAPMDPNYRSDKPGKSPMGMDLVPVYAGSASQTDESVVSIDPRIVANLGVRTAAVEFGPLPRRVDTVGYVGYDEDTLQQVATRVDGWVERLSVKYGGERVSRGELLFELYSPTLVNAQEEYLAALKSSSGKLQGASRERLVALGMTGEEIDRLTRDRRVRQRVSVVSPLDGYVSHLGVREGSYVTPATQIMSIARLDQVWVLAEVFERQAHWVRPGQRAAVELDYLPGKRWQAQVDYVYPELDPMTRTLTVRLRFANESEFLQPNMFARVVIEGSRTDDVVHVPREAVIRGGSVDRVAVLEGAGRFRVQPVELGVEAGDRVEIRRGLKPGTRVVTSGQFLIDSEANLESALARFEARADQPSEAMEPEMDHAAHGTAPAVDDLGPGTRETGRAP